MEISARRRRSTTTMLSVSAAAVVLALVTASCAAPPTPRPADGRIDFSVLENGVLVGEGGGTVTAQPIFDRIDIPWDLATHFDYRLSTAAGFEGPTGDWTVRITRSPSFLGSIGHRVEVSTPDGGLSIGGSALFTARTDSCNGTPGRGATLALDQRDPADASIRYEIDITVCDPALWLDYEPCLVLICYPISSEQG